MASKVQESRRERIALDRGVNYFSWRYVANLPRVFQARRLVDGDAPLSAFDRELLTQGIALGHVSQMLTPSGLQAYSEVRTELLDRWKSEPIQEQIRSGQSNYSKKSFLVQLVDPAIDPDGPLARLALDENLLRIVTRYLGFAPVWFDTFGWCNFPTPEEASASQLWHRDPEDRQLIKVFVYLDDVDADTGPFQYVLRSHSRNEEGFKTPRYRDSRRVTDEDMEATYPHNGWKACTGPAGSLIVADTVGFHKGGKPKSRDRILVTMTYTSGSPRSKRAIRFERTPSWSMSKLQKLAFVRDIG